MEEGWNHITSREKSVDTARHGLQALKDFKREIAHMEGHFFVFPESRGWRPNLHMGHRIEALGSAESPRERKKSQERLLEPMSTRGRQSPFWPQVQL